MATRHEEARDELQSATTVLAEQHADHERAAAHEALAELSRRLGDEDGASQHAQVAEALRNALLPSFDNDI